MKRGTFKRIIALAVSLLLCMQPIAAMALDESGLVASELSSIEMGAGVSSNDAEAEVSSDGTGTEAEVSSNGTEADVILTKEEVNVTPTGTEAETSSSETGLIVTRDEPEVVYTMTSAPWISTFGLTDGKVDLNDGNFPRWIDRVNLPDYALEIYNILSDEKFWTDEANFSQNTDGVYGNVEHVQKTYSDGSTDDYIGLKINKPVELDSSIATPYITAAVNAFDRDHPEVFWCEGSIQYYGYTSTSSDGTKSYYRYLVLKDFKDSDVDIRKSEYQDVSKLKEEISKRDSAIKEITSGATGSNYSKVKYFNEWLTKHNEYNTVVAGIDSDSTASPYAWECISALYGNKGVDGPVCEGYARAFKVLCDNEGISCVLVDGYASGKSSEEGEAHMWNFVEIGGHGTVSMSHGMIRWYGVKWVR